MKRIAVLMMMLVFGLTAVMSAAETNVNTNWDFYGGGVNIDFQSGDDARVQFNTAGNHAFGNFSGTDYDNNPYSYNVDNTRSRVTANVEAGGVIQFRMDRQDSKTSMYGDPGQFTQTFIQSDDGNAAFATSTRANFADMITGNYGFQANNQYSATGSVYVIDHSIQADPNKYAGFYATGNGATTVTLMSSEMRASGWRFGEGAGCYTNASASGTGTGYFEVYANATNSLSGNNWSAGGGSFSGIISYNNGFEYNNINMRGN